MITYTFIHTQIVAYTHAITLSLTDLQRPKAAKALCCKA